MKRKIISVMLTGTMIAGMLTGCGSDSSSKSSSSVISGSSETETETTEADESDDKTPVTFEYFNADGKNGNWDNPVAKAIRGNWCYVGCQLSGCIARRCKRGCCVDDCK